MNNKIWRYYEGTTSANTVIKDLAKVLCTAVKTKEIKDDGGQTVRQQEVIMGRNWDIVYPQPDRLAKELKDVMNWSELTPEEFSAKINNQIKSATDTIILKTRTTAREGADSNSIDDIGLENDLAKDSIDMYVELYKPTYLADPEVYHPECERHGIMPYLVTRDIYKEFAKKEGNESINLKEALSGGTDQLKNVLINNIKDSGSNTSGYMEAARAKAIANELVTKYNLTAFNVIANNSLGRYDNPDTGKVKIPYSTLKLILAGTSDLSATINSIYTPSSINREYEVTIRMTKGYNDINNTRVYIEWTRDIEEYVINPGFEYKLKEGESVKWDTVSIVYEDDTTGNNLMASFVVDKLTYKIKCVKKVTARTEIFGDPILTYTYTKEDATIDAKKLLPNNHYCYIRMFDKLNSEGNGPMANVVDEISGEVIQQLSKISEWSKLSWYQDFEEVAVDAMDSDPGESNMSKGIVYLPLETPGLNGDTRLRFWINCNNNRATMVFMGNPSLDFSSNRHLISTAYLGQIDSFDNSINDVAGNFALFTSSSTAPCSSKTITKKVTQTSKDVIGVGDESTTEFRLALTGEKFLDVASATSVHVTGTDGSVTTIRQGEGYNLSISGDKKFADIVLFTAPALGSTIELEYGFYTIKATSVKGIIRDGLGNVINTVYPDTYGVNTATGVIDVSMLHTRSKAYFQKHHFMFTTTEEFMTKEMYGKSAYTGEYYADKIKITHGNDGPRGMLSEMLAIDTSSLYAFDELIVNRDFSKDAKKEEETYVFFPITAPFSPFSGSPNATFGVAIKKSYKKPIPTTDQEKLEQALEDIDLYVGNLKNLTKDIYLPTKLEHGVTVTWSSDHEDLINFNPGRVAAARKR